MTNLEKMMNKADNKKALASFLVKHIDCRECMAMGFECIAFYECGCMFYTEDNCLKWLDEESDEE